MAIYFYTGYMITINLSSWDYFVFITYAFFLLYLGYRAYGKTDRDRVSDFLLANRSLTLPSFVATLVTTWYGGILGIGEFTYLHGVSTWFIFGLPYYFFAALFAVFLAGRIRKRNLYTIPDMLYSTYGKKAGFLGSIIVLIMTSPAPYILMVGYLIQWIFGFSFIFSLILGALISTVYVYFGGFRSVIRTDILQFVLMFLGFTVFLIFLIKMYGGWKFLQTSLDYSYFIWHGNLSWQYIFVWFFIASWTFIDPGFYQRCSAASSPDLARRGIFVSIGFWLIFDMLTIFSGLYAAALISDIPPAMAYPFLGNQVLPPIIKGLFLTGLLAVIMSTVDSFSFLSAITFGRDILWRTNKNKNVIAYTRVGLIFTALTAILMAWLIPSVIELWYIIGSLTIPPMLLPMLSAYFQRYILSPGETLWIMILSFIISILAFLWGVLNAHNGQYQYMFALEPFFPGLIFSFSGYGILIIKKRLLFYGRRK
jgi:SSS family solute:Na+ symporter